MRKTMAAIGLLVILAVPAEGQNYLLAGDGWEAFPGVEYQGGDTRYPKKLSGVLVLTDTTIALYPCRAIDGNGGCFIARDRLPWAEPAHFIIRLASLGATSSNSQVRGPGAGSRMMFGSLAGDRVSETLRLVHEHDGTAEAPMFRVHPVQSGAIEAKIAARLRRLEP